MLNQNFSSHFVQSIFGYLTLLSVLANSVMADSMRPPLDRPNFVVIFIDDMGYGDIGPFGSTSNRTPNLDQMASQGNKLTSFYVASPVCTPSRAALMTGCYPQRIGLQRGSGHIVLFPGDHHGLHPNEVTVAETLKHAGYATGCFGKWHLGDQPPFLPTAQGFDTYFGIPYSNDMWPPLRRFQCPQLPILQDTEVVDIVDDMDDQATLCRRFTEATVQFIKKNKDQPFFAYLPHAFVHSPRLASPRFMKGASTVEQAQVEEVDWSVGRILSTLREENLHHNTLVIFTSDNGPAGGLSAGPLRGRKGSAYEGGHREPTIAWWPGIIPPGSSSDEIITALDIHPTFAALAKASIPKDRIIDGHDNRDILFAKPQATTPYKRFFYQQGGKLAAVRAGDWKLFTNGELYHLTTDLSEKTNVAKSNPDVVQALKQHLEDFAKEIETGARPVGLYENARTLAPRPGIMGDEAYIPTLKLPLRK